MNDFGKNWKPPRSDADSTKLASRLHELRSTLRLRDPSLVAARSGISYLTLGPDRGELHVPLWEKMCILPWPELHNDSLSEFQQTLLLYYLATADDASLADKWVSFAELPDGRMYNAAFQGYSGDEVVRKFGLDLAAFKSACLHSEGKPVEIGSASFIFQALPRVPLLATYWLGDEDFPSSCKILFDESACHYLPIDACAILGSMLTRKLIASASHLT
jgi:hypothetical protein